MVAVLPGGWEYLPIAYDNYNSAWGDGCAVPRYPPAVPRRGRHALLAPGNGRPCGRPGSLGTRPPACSLADRILAHRRPGVRLGFRHRRGDLRLLPGLESLTTRSDRSPQVRVTHNSSLRDERLASPGPDGLFGRGEGCAWLTLFRSIRSSRSRTGA